MFIESTVYAPILKWKKGEKIALQRLTDEQRKKVFPIIEVPDDFEDDPLIEELSECCSIPAAVDTLYVENDRDILVRLMENVSKYGSEIYPVIYYEDFPVIADQLVEHTSHVILRLPIPESLDYPHAEVIETALRWNDNNDTKLVLMLDMQIIDSKRTASIAFTDLRNVLDKHILPVQSKIDKVLISGTSFPEDLNSLQAGDQALYPRLDFQIFNKIYSGVAYSDLRDKIIFSDYGVTKYTASQIDPRWLGNVLPKGKYTTHENYWVIKGKRDKKTRETVEGYREIAVKIYRSKDYYGKDFSMGDLDIFERATNQKGVGNNTTWVTIAANHHMAVLIEQLSTLYGV